MCGMWTPLEIAPPSPLDGHKDVSGVARIGSCRGSSALSTTGSSYFLACKSSPALPVCPPWMARLRCPSFRFATHAGEILDAPSCKHRQPQRPQEKGQQLITGGVRVPHMVATQPGETTQDRRRSPPAQQILGTPGSLMAACLGGMGQRRNLSLNSRLYRWA